MNESFWYVMRVLPGKERLLTEQFNEYIKNGYIGFIKRFICPIEKEYITVRKKKVLRDKVIYNGYIYFESEDKLEEDSLKIMSSYENIMMIAGTKLPQLLRKTDIDRIIKDEDLDKRVKSQVGDFVVGESVEIISGPFLSFSGIVKEIIGEKITLDVAVFGRPTKVSLFKEEIKRF